MEDYRNDYPEYDDVPGASSPDKSIRGYRVVIILLAVILAAMSILYFNIHRQQMADYELLQVDRDSIQNNLSHLMDDFDNLRINNDSISASLGMERERADSLMERLKKERSWSYAKIKQYEKEVGTLQTLMRNYLRQIDSLNTLNKQLISENVSYRKEISTISQRAELAEEKAAELDNMVKQGSVLKARNIRLTSLNAKSKEVTRIKNAARLRTDFTLAANELTTPGDKTVYVRILRALLRGGPDLRLRGRTPLLLGPAQHRLPERGHRRRHLLQRLGIHGRKIHRSTLCRGPPDRLRGDRHAL